VIDQAVSPRSRWCAGAYVGEVTEVVAPSVCSPNIFAPCQQIIDLREVGSFSFRIRQQKR
jgi:hypothetical protein